MTKVKLRKAPISKSRHSLYLDYYPAIPNPKTGKTTRREFLKLYLLDNPKSPFDKQQNKETLALAEAIRSKRQVEIQNGSFGFMNREKANTNFIEFFEALVGKKVGSNKTSWRSALGYLTKFSGGQILMKDLSVSFCNDYKEYLLSTASKKSPKTTLSQNTASAYFGKFQSALKKAHVDGYLQEPIHTKITSIKVRETRREFLTLEEMKTLMATPCQSDLLKKAALFSALTGMRFSDIKELKWSDVNGNENDGFAVNFVQQKTKGVETHPVSNQAIEILGVKGGNSDLVFEGLHYSAYNNTIIKKWVKDAGITKHITFHCFRHTYATLQLSLGTDIYTVSKMLGHRELKTTQIYAQIVDDAKRKAADKMRF